MRIGVVLGSVRDGRRGEAIGEWVWDAAHRRQEFEYEWIDLKAFEIPVLTSAVQPSKGERQYESQKVGSWSRTIDSCQGFIFITPEYNHGVPGAFKNAVDSLGPEWIGKAVGFVAYGADAGVRAVEHWRQILANFEMMDVRSQVNLSTFGDFDESDFSPLHRRVAELERLLEALELATWRQTLSPSSSTIK